MVSDVQSNAINMKFAVIGAKGQIGSDFVKLSDTCKIYQLDHDQVDVTNRYSLEKCLTNIDCSALINLAAFHKVNECEQDPFKSLNVNAIGAANVAWMAKGKNCKVIYFSSDYVFGRESERKLPYLESDIVGPLNVYGTSKVAGEQLVRIIHKDHLVVRTSSVFGVNTSRKGATFPE